MEKTDDFTALALRLLSALQPGKDYRVRVDKSANGEMNVKVDPLEAKPVTPPG